MHTNTVPSNHHTALLLKFTFLSASDIESYWSADNVVIFKIATIIIILFVFNIMLCLILIPFIFLFFEKNDNMADAIFAAFKNIYNFLNY